MPQTDLVQKTFLLGGKSNGHQRVLVDYPEKASNVKNNLIFKENVDSSTIS